MLLLLVLIYQSSKAFQPFSIRALWLFLFINYQIIEWPVHCFGFPGGASDKELACQCKRHQRCGFDPWVGKIPWRRAWKPTPVFLPGESAWTEEPGGLVHGVTKSQTQPKWLSIPTNTLQHTPNLNNQWNEVFEDIHCKRVSHIAGRRFTVWATRKI